MSEQKEPTPEQWEKAFEVADRIVQGMSEEEIDQLIEQSECEEEEETNAEIKDNMRTRLGMRPLNLPQQHEEKGVDISGPEQG